MFQFANLSAYNASIELTIYAANTGVCYKILRTAIVYASLQNLFNCLLPLVFSLQIRLVYEGGSQLTCKSINNLILFLLQTVFKLLLIV